MRDTTQTTPATDALCRDIAKRSRGVCFVGLSGGKDSLAALVCLHRYFRRVIPFHCASWPGAKYEREYLDRLEYELGGTRILRLIGEDFPMSLARGFYQSYDNCLIYSETGSYCEDFSKLDVLEHLRYAYNLPKAWCAFGIAASDSIDRLIYVRKNGGRNDRNRTFYPCFDFTRQQILDVIREAHLPLVSSYRYMNRSMGSVPSYTCNEILRRHYPADWEHFLALYPLAEAKTVRERILDREWKAKRDAQILANGGTPSADPVRVPPSVEADEGDDGVMDGDWIEDPGVSAEEEETGKEAS